MDTYLYEILIFFGPRSRLVKPRLKICAFVDFLGIEILKHILDTHLRYSLDTYFMIFGAILALIQGCENQGWKDAFFLFFWLSQNWVLKVDLVTHLRDKHGDLFLWDLELFWPSFKVGQTKDANMHFCKLSHNWVLKVDLNTHLRDKHGHLFLWDLELFWPSFNVL